MLLLISLFACSTETAEITDDTLALSQEIAAAETLEVVAVQVDTTEEAPDLEISEPELSEIAEAEPLETPVFTTIVRSGENLVLIAQWADVSVEDVLAVNPGLDPSRDLRVGHELALPGETDEDYVAMRQVWSDARLTRYLDKRGGLAGTMEHRVETGDTAWGLAKNEADVPMWVLAAFNEGDDLERLRIGDTIIMPVLNDQVAALPSETDPTMGQ